MRETTLLFILGRIQFCLKKLLNNFANTCPNNHPTRMIENTPKTIWTRSTITNKIKNNIIDFQIIRAFNQHNILLKGNHSINTSTNKIFHITSNVSIRIKINIEVYIKIQNMILNEPRILNNTIIGF